MRDIATVNELINQLERMREQGFGEAEVWFRDYNDRDHEMEMGVIDDNGLDRVVLG